MTQNIRLSEEDVRNCTWTLVEQTQDYRRYIGRGTHPKTGLPIVVQKTEALVAPALLEANRQAQIDTQNSRWSQGSGTEKGGNVPMVKVASIPLNKLFADLGGAIRTGDKDQLKWWLNRDENAPFRTRTGKL